MPRVEVLRRRRLLDDFLKVDEAVLRHERQDGTLSPPLRRLSVERGDGAAALLRRRDNGNLVLVRQFRYPTHGNGPGWLLELVAGMVEACEAPAAAIRREIEEETGFASPELHHLATFYLSPGGSSERIHLFLAQADAGGRTPGGGLESADEDIEIVEMDTGAAFRALDAGEIQDAKTIIALQWLRLHTDRLAI